MQSNRTFLFVFMHCKVQEVVCCHSIRVLAQLQGSMKMSHAYPLQLEQLLVFQLQSSMFPTRDTVDLQFLNRKYFYYRDQMFPGLLDQVCTHCALMMTPQPGQLRSASVRSISKSWNGLASLQTQQNIFARSLNSIFPSDLMVLEWFCMQEWALPGAVCANLVK